MKESKKSHQQVEIRVAQDEDLYDLNLCVKDFLDFINNFKQKFKEKKFFILTAYYNEILSGVLIAKDKTKKVDSLQKILPKMSIKLIFVNPKFRNMNIGRDLLDTFLEIQKENGFASVYVKLPQKYKRGIKFFQNNDFLIINKRKSRIVLEINLWNDFGVRDCCIIDNNFNDMFY